MAKEVVIVEAVRTAMGRRNGMLSGTHPVKLGAIVLNEVVKRAGIEPGMVGDVVFGNVSQVGEQAANIGRNVVLEAGFPIEVPGTTVDRQCGSGQQAIHFAANLISSDVVDIAIGGGVEVMSRVPMGSNFQVAGFPFTQHMRETYDLTSQGVAADNIARQWGFSRQQLDEFALQSQERAKAARDAGKFEKEIVGVDVEHEGVKGVFKVDEGIRDTSLEKLSTLQPSFGEDGLHHAGNSSQITDGAAAVLLMSADKAKELGLKPRARIVAQAVVGSDPHLMLTGPITATPAVLKKAGLKLEDIDRVEINEAFASVVLAWQKETGADLSKVNVNGGAIALGHPLGATGVRLMTTLLNELERTGGRYGLQTMCEGGGMANATIIERLG
ncbi:MAG TPA: thiolase family protein [Dehalococcoidia bacterium]|nr:thiolase family protein [Dehalococcoidia bacterium]